VSEANCASWVQAWGSIAAIGAAIAIAYVQRRSEAASARLTATVRAEIAGASVLLMLTPILGALGAVRRRINGPQLGMNGPEMVDIMQRMAFPTEQELTAVADHLPQCARTLIEGRNLARQGHIAVELVARQIRVGGMAMKDQLAPVDEVLALAENRFKLAELMLDEFVPKV
jgi:hypothetical protein